MFYYYFLKKIIKILYTHFYIYKKNKILFKLKYKINMCFLTYDMHVYFLIAKLKLK